MTLQPHWPGLFSACMGTETYLSCSWISFSLYIHACMHEYIHIYIHTYLPTYIHTYLPTYIHTCIYIYTVYNWKVIEKVGHWKVWLQRSPKGCIPWRCFWSRCRPTVPRRSAACCSGSSPVTPGDWRDMWRNSSPRCSCWDAGVSMVTWNQLLYWLVVWNMAFMTFHILEVFHPNWRTHIFQRGWNHQPVYDESEFHGI